jgi:hypothetical protein
LRRDHSLAARWTPEQVRGDGTGGEAVQTKQRGHSSEPSAKIARIATLLPRSGGGARHRGSGRRTPISRSTAPSWVVERRCWSTHRPKRPVTPDSFRGPLRGEERGLSGDHSPSARWTPEQVRGDGRGGQAVPPKQPRHSSEPPAPIAHRATRLPRRGGGARHRRADGGRPYRALPRHSGWPNVATCRHIAPKDPSPRTWSGVHSAARSGA